jgi:hypothetical protein
MPAIEIVPASARRWTDLQQVMAGCAVASKCWCAYWYESAADYKRGWGTTNHETLERLVKVGREPGLIGYVDAAPAAWVSVAPRGDFDRLNRSRNFAPLDDKNVWAVNCFVVARGFRRMGLMSSLATAAAEFALERGADGAEGYPVEPGPKTGAGDLYLGTINAFASAGYREVARPLPRRAIMRRMR